LIITISIIYGYEDELCDRKFKYVTLIVADMTMEHITWQ